MPIRRFFIYACLFVFTSAVCSTATAYQWDASLRFQQLEYDNKDQHKVYSLAVKAFIEPVDAKQGMYAEQAFLGRVSSVTALATYHRLHGQAHDASDIRGGGVSVTSMDKSSRLFLQSGYYHHKSKQGNVTGIKANTHFRNYWLRAGAFVGSKALLYGLLDYYEWSNLAAKEDEVALGMGLKVIHQNINLEMKVLNITYDEGVQDYVNKERALKLDYYLNPALSVGGQIEQNRGEFRDDEYDEASLNIVGYLQERIYLGAEYVIHDMKSSSQEDAKQIVLFSGMRW